MIRYSTVVSIGRPVGEVFGALLDADLYPRWTEMTDASFEGEGPPGVGTRGEFRLPAGPLKGRYAMEILALEPGRRLDIGIDGSALHWISRISLESDGDGTRMTYGGDISLLGWRRLLEPFMSREARAGETHEAERFKALLESEAAPA